MTRRLAPIAALALVLVLGCGEDDPGLNEEASRALQFQAQAVRDSAESFDPAGVERGLADLRASVAQMKEDGTISDDRAAAILAAAADVEALVGEVPTTTTTTTTTLPLPPPPVDDEVDDDKDKDKGKGNDDD